MEATVTRSGKMKFRIEERLHVIESDQSVENGGDVSAVTPPEFFLASLASCVAFYAAQYLAIRKLADRGVEVEIDAEKLREPSRLGNLRPRVKSPVALTTDQLTGM